MVYSARVDEGFIVRSAGVFVLLSETEGDPVSVLEAMACGLPCVCTDVGGLSRLIQQGVSGYLVPRGRFDLAVSHIVELLDDHELCVRMGAAGREFVQSHRSVDSTMSRYVEVLEGAIRRRADGGER